MSDGFVRLPYQLIDSGRLTLIELGVYIALLRHRDHHTGRCWPSYSTIAREARVSRSTALRTIKSLEDAGIIRVTPTEPRKPNVYEVALFEAFPSRDTEQSRDAESGVRETLGGLRETPGGVTKTPGMVHPDTSAGVRVTPEVEPLTSSIEVASSNSTHEAALRSSDPDDAPPQTQFAFITEPEKPVTERQLTYLRDSYIHHIGDAPPQHQVDSWHGLSTVEADALLKQYQRATPRGDDYRGPEFGDPAYDRLSTAGQDAADRAMIPDRGGGTDESDETWRDLFGPPLPETPQPDDF